MKKILSVLIAILIVTSVLSGTEFDFFAKAQSTQIDWVTEKPVSLYNAVTNPNGWYEANSTTGVQINSVLKFHGNNTFFGDCHDTTAYAGTIDFGENGFTKVGASINCGIGDGVVNGWGLYINVFIDGTMKNIGFVTLVGTADWEITFNDSDANLNDLGKGLRGQQKVYVYGYGNQHVKAIRFGNILLPTKVECESGMLSNGANVQTNKANASGGTVIGMTPIAVGEISEALYTINVSKAGIYEFEVFYSANFGTAVRKANYKFDGGTPTGINIQDTGSWTDFSSDKIYVNLTAGTHSFSLLSTPDYNGTTIKPCNFDYFTYSLSDSTKLGTSTRLFHGQTYNWLANADGRLSVQTIADKQAIAHVPLDSSISIKKKFTADFSSAKVNDVILKVSLYLDSALGTNATGNIKIKTGDRSDAVNTQESNQFSFPLQNLNLKAGWNELELPLSSATLADGDNFKTADWFCVWLNDNGSNITVALGNVEIFIGKTGSNTGSTNHPIINNRVTKYNATTNPNGWTFVDNNTLVPYNSTTQYSWTYDNNNVLMIGDTDQKTVLCGVMDFGQGGFTKIAANVSSAFGEGVYSGTIYFKVLKDGVLQNIGSVYCTGTGDWFNAFKDQYSSLNALGKSLTGEQKIYLFIGGSQNLRGIRFGDEVSILVPYDYSGSQNTDELSIINHVTKYNATSNPDGWSFVNNTTLIPYENNSLNSWTTDQYNNLIIGDTEEKTIYCGTLDFGQGGYTKIAANVSSAFADGVYSGTIYFKVLTNDVLENIGSVYCTGTADWFNAFKDQYGALNALGQSLTGQQKIYLFIAGTQNLRGIRFGNASTILLPDNYAGSSIPTPDDTIGANEQGFLDYDDSIGYTDFFNPSRDDVIYNTEDENKNENEGESNPVTGEQSKVILFALLFITGSALTKAARKNRKPQ